MLICSSFCFAFALVGSQIILFMIFLSFISLFLTLSSLGFCCSLELWLTTPALCCRIALNEWQGVWFIFWVTAQKTNLHQSKARQGSVTPQSDMLGGAYSKKDRWSLIADLHCRSLITEISSKVIDSACSGRQDVISSNFLSKCEGLNSTDSFTYFPYSYGNRVMRKLEEWNISSARKCEHELWWVDSTSTFVPKEAKRLLSQSLFSSAELPMQKWHHFTW